MGGEDAVAAFREHGALSLSVVRVHQTCREAGLSSATGASPSSRRCDGILKMAKLSRTGDGATLHESVPVLRGPFQEGIPWEHVPGALHPPSRNRALASTS